MDSKKIKENEKKHVMQTYGRFDIIVDHGKGCYVYSKEGKEYLDFLGGIACCSVGHSNKKVTDAISDQAGKLLNVTNYYYTEPQVELDKKLSELSGLKKCFFANSGTEANEAAIKLAKKITGKKKFIAFNHCFHGRTTGSLSATWKEKYKKPFAPLVPEVKFVPYDDIDALEKEINSDIAGVIIEPIQGEAGIIVPSDCYLKKVKELCSKNKVLMIVDEVQSGNGRTGKYFAYQHSGIKPDIVTTAKGLANGVPIGVCISDYDFDKGDHASTFGGNNLACAAANATVDFIIDNNLMENAVDVGEYFMSELNKLKSKHPVIKEVRGKGLMIAVELNKDEGKKIVDNCLDDGMLINNAAENILRFLPPLTVTKKEIDKAISILDKVLS
jgi:acetylornithine/N-succinyldiaminopimelate aminotransferase